jgi:hypothetical protein
MLVQQMNMLGNVPVIEIRDACIKKDVKKKCEIENIKVKPIRFQTNRILNGPVDPENPERLDQEIQRKR